MGQDELDGAGHARQVEHFNCELVSLCVTEGSIPYKRNEGRSLLLPANYLITF